MSVSCLKRHRSGGQWKLWLQHQGEYFSSQTDGLESSGPFFSLNCNQQGHESRNKCSYLLGYPTCALGLQMACKLCRHIWLPSPGTWWSCCCILPTSWMLDLWKLLFWYFIVTSCVGCVWHIYMYIVYKYKLYVICATHTGIHIYEPEA